MASLHAAAQEGREEATRRGAPRKTSPVRLESLVWSFAQRKSTVGRRTPPQPRNSGPLGCATAIQNTAHRDKKQG